MKLKSIIKIFSKTVLITTVAIAGFSHAAVSQTTLSQTTKAQDHTCVYSLDTNSVKVAWTAFKTTAKLPVNGEFTSINVSSKPEASSLSALLKGLEVRVNPDSTATQNPERDKTLKDFFFAKLLGTITGQVKEVAEDAHQLVITLKLNQQEKDLVFVYTSLDQLNYTATSNLNLLDYAGAEALALLNKQCYELHKGPDGVSKTWSDVTINLSGRIKKTC